MRYPLAIEIAYRRLLDRLVAHMRMLIKKHLMPEIDALVADAMPPEFFRQDAPAGWRDRMERALEKIVRDMANPIRITERELDDLGSRTDDFNKREWQRLIRSRYGVSPTGESSGKYDRMLKEWADINARLIKDIPAKTMRQIREQAIDALTQGTNVRDTTQVMRDIMEERIEVSDSRAELIARDQVAKLNGQLTKERQTDNGVEQYIWRTVGDERVRDSHQAVDGETFSWDSPPAGTDFNHPGEDYQCRCWADPVLPDVMRFEASLRDDLEEAA